MENKKLLVVCGPTATGKTELAVRLAKKYDGEIVSADSRQVYQGMDLATGKDLPSGAKFHPVKSKAKFGMGYYLFDNVPVWMLDVAKPDYVFTVADFHEIAHTIIENIIWKKGKLPIVAGGTGFYIKALTDGIETIGAPPNQELRKAYEDKNTGELYQILLHLDPEKAAGLNSSDRQNKRRLIRKIELAQTKSLQKSLKEWPNLNILFIGLTAALPVLYQKIDKRIDSWIKDNAEEEVKKLTRQYSWDLPAMTGIGYRQWQPFFKGEATLAETIQRWKYDEHAYARRQMTWFRKTLRQAQGKTNQQVIWFDITKTDYQKKVEKIVSSWYNKN